MVDSCYSWELFLYRVTNNTELVNIQSLLLGEIQAQVLVSFITPDQYITLFCVFV